MQTRIFGPGMTPVVFAQLVDPVGAGFVASLAHPGGNITGFADFEFSMDAKWLQLCYLRSGDAGPPRTMTLERLIINRGPWRP